MPVKAVAIDEVWKIQMPAFLKAFEKETKTGVIADKATGSGKLVKAYKKDGRQYGDIVVTLDLPVKTLKIEQGDIGCQPGTTFTVEMKATACIDGSIDDAKAQWTMQFQGKGVFPSENPMIRMDFMIRSVSENSFVEVLKK